MAFERAILEVEVTSVLRKPIDTDPVLSYISCNSRPRALRWCEENLPARFVAQRRTLVMRFAIWIGEGMVWMRSGIKKLVALVFGIGVLACGLAVAQTAIDDLRTRAERGDAEAQNSLGLRYVLGDGIAQDKAAAHHWFELSAKQGYAKGQYNLAVMLGSGLSGQKDHKESVKWYRKAAEQGLNAADYNLTEGGFMFSNGQSGSQQKRQDRRESHEQ